MPTRYTSEMVAKSLWKQTTNNVLWTHSKLRLDSPVSWTKTKHYCKKKSIEWLLRILCYTQIIAILKEDSCSIMWEQITDESKALNRESETLEYSALN